MPQSASTKQQQTPKQSQLLIDTERKKLDAARLYDKWNNSWELYKPYRTLHNYLS